jgi:hypothetical protein
VTISEQFSEAAEEKGLDIDGDQLENLTSRYTMDSERAVHHGAVKESDQAREQSTADNIELFGDESDIPVSGSSEDPDNNIDLFMDNMDDSQPRHVEDKFELSDQPEEKKKNTDQTEENEDDLGDNVELF